MVEMESGGGAGGRGGARVSKLKYINWGHVMVQFAPLRAVSSIFAMGSKLNGIVSPFKIH